MEPKVKVHCGSAYVSGKARSYPYFIAQVFRPAARRDGVVTYRSTGRIVGPFRSFNKATREGKSLAEQLGIGFVDGYGSLHGKELR